MSSVDSETAKANGSATKKQSLKNCFKDFLEYTTAHGCGRLAASRTVFWKVFWVVLGIAAHVSFWYHFVVISDDYMNKPVRTKVTITRNKILDFPVVTICNRNMLRNSKLTNELKTRIKEIRNTTLEFWRNHTREFKKTHPHSADSELLHLMDDRLEKMRQAITKVPPEKLNEMGHQLQDMVLDCIIDGEDCIREIENKNIWRHIWIEDVGNCYMFNRVLHGDNIEPQRTSLTGDKHGLRLLINIEQYEYLQGISPYAGLKVIIGSQGEMPFPLSEGINVGPGLTTSVEIVMRQSSRLDPFNNNSCEQTRNLETSNIYHRYNMTYSKMACRLSCLSNMQVSRCNCSQYHFTGSDNIGYCIRSIKEIDECVEDVQADFVNGACEDKCPPQCLDTQYPKTISSYKWPANMFKLDVLESLQHLSNISLKSSEEISDNLLELHVYYAAMDYELVEEALKYGPEDLISNIGGQMGMWIGVSALTIAELIELFWFAANALLRRKNPNSSSPEN